MRTRPHMNMRHIDLRPNLRQDLSITHHSLSLSYHQESQPPTSRGRSNLRSSLQRQTRHSFTQTPLYQ
jgi:hypothetical protein